MIQNELEEDCEEFDSDLETETETTPSESSSGTSVLSADLFQTGKDDIILEGELYKFKPGISQNFIERYV